MMIAGNLWAVIEDTQKEFGFWIAVRKEVHRSFRRAFDLSIDAVTGCTIMGLRTTRFGEKFYNPPYTRQDFCKHKSTHLISAKENLRCSTAKSHDAE